MLSNEASPANSLSHLLVCPLGEETHEIPPPWLGHNTHTLMALCMVSSTLGLRQTPTCQAEGVVTTTGQGGQAEESGKWQERIRAVTEGWGSQHSLQPNGPFGPCEQWWILTSLAGPLSTRTVFPQEAGGMLERVESRTQTAICTEQGWKEKGLRSSPKRGIQFRISTAEVVPRKPQRPSTKIRSLPKPGLWYRAPAGEENPHRLGPDGWVPPAHLPRETSLVGFLK